MSRVIEAIVKDGEVRPLEPLDLPDETRVKILIDQEDGTNANTAAEREHDPLATIYELAEDAGPADLSINLDHYLYGLPKQQ
jgi:predicted DNA-binding antitoxin AbrB/MazE fold protein